MTTLTFTIEGPDEATEEKFAKEFRSWMDNQGEQDFTVWEEEHLRGLSVQFKYPKDGILAVVTKK